MKKKYILMLVAIALVATTIIGGTLAALNTTTEGGAGAAKANITLKDMGVALAKPVDKEITGMPGGEWKNPSATIENALNGGYSIYVKAVVDYYWKDIDDTESAKVTPFIQSANTKIDIPTYTGKYADAGELTDANGNKIVDASGWLIVYHDDGQIIMYYTKPVAYGEQTTPYLSGIKFPVELNNAYADKELTVEVSTTAVQANSAVDAIASELGVTVTLDDEGNIVSVAE